MIKVDLGDGKSLRFTFNHSSEAARIGYKKLDGDKVEILRERPVTRCYLDYGDDTFEGKVSLFHKDKYDRDLARKGALEKAIQMANLPRDARVKVWDAYFGRIPKYAPEVHILTDESDEPGTGRILAVTFSKEEIEKAKVTFERRGLAYTRTQVLTVAARFNPTSIKGEADVS